MPVIPVILVAATLAGTAMQVSASQAAAKNAKNVADYNAAVDREQAKQLSIDTSQNILREREQSNIYLSRQKSAIAANGLLTAGSPLDLLATSASQMESNIQDEYHSSLIKESSLYSAADAGIAEGAAQSDAYKTQGTISLFQGVSSMAGQYGNYAASH